MKYLGEDKNANECLKFIKENCIVERTLIDAYNIEIFIYTKEMREQIACIKGFLYDYNTKRNFGKFDDALHIKSLGTSKNFLRKGFATYLMKEAIKYGEYKKVKHITIHPRASILTISQEDLETFYKRFLFTYRFFFIKREKKLKFENVSD